MHYLGNINIYAKYCGFKLRSGQTIVNEISVCCFSERNAALMRKSKDGLSRNQNNVSFLSADCCFSELAQSKPITHVGLVQREHHYNHLKVRLYDCLHINVILGTYVIFNFTRIKWYHICISITYLRIFIFVVSSFRKTI